MSLRPRDVLRKGRSAVNVLVLGGNQKRITQNRQTEQINFLITIYCQLIFFYKVNVLVLGGNQKRITQNSQTIQIRTIYNKRKGVKGQ